MCGSPCLPPILGTGLSSENHTSFSLTGILRHHPRHRPRHCRRSPARWADLELPLASSASRRLGETTSARRNAVSLQRPLREWARLAASCSPTLASTNQPQPGLNSLSWFPDSDSSLYWTVCGVIFVSSVKLRWMNSRFGQFEFRYSPSPQARSRALSVFSLSARLSGKTAR